MRPIYPSIEIPNEQFLLTVTANEFIDELDGFEILDRTPCDPQNGGIGTIQVRASDPQALKRLKYRGGPDYAIFANPGRIAAFDRKKVLWVFNANEDKRFQGKLPGRLYVFADYFGKVMKTSWATHHRLLPPDFLQFMEAPVPTPPTIKIELPLGKEETL